MTLAQLGTAPLPSKTELRPLLQALRATIAADFRRKASREAAQHFMNSPLLKAAKHIALYLPLAHEMDTRPLLQMLWDAHKNCYLPLVPYEGTKVLGFALYEPEDELAPNRFQILEPQNTQTIAPNDLDIVVLPLLGFDEHGHRLGTGGGYYDHTFAFTTKHAHTKPVLIGLGFGLQKMAEFAHESTDVPMQGVVTEVGYQTFGKAQQD